MHPLLLCKSLRTPITFYTMPSPVEMRKLLPCYPNTQLSRSLPIVSTTSRMRNPNFSFEQVYRSIRTLAQKFFAQHSTMGRSALTHRGGPHCRPGRDDSRKIRRSYSLQMTIATSDGNGIWAFRYSTMHVSQSLFYSTELFDDLLGAWNAVLENMYGVIQDGDDEMLLFSPIVPWMTVRTISHNIDICGCGIYAS